MRIVKASREQLDRIARERYQEHFAQQAPVSVRNAQALVALGEHRPLRWRGHAYRVPPLPWRQGAQLLVVSQVLATGEPSDRERAVHVARLVMHDLVRVSRIGRGWVKPWRNPFRTESADGIKWLCDFFLRVPDDNAPPSGATVHSVDLMDGLLEVARTFPAFINADGIPVSWAAYQYALRHLHRVRVREKLSVAEAARIAQAKPEDWKAYASEARSAAGYN